MCYRKVRISTSTPKLPSGVYLDCTGRRRQYIGEKCFALLVVFLVVGVVLTGFGTACLIPVSHKYVTNNNINN